MKKKFMLFIITLLVLFTTACSLGTTPTSTVEKLLANYNNQDEDIVVELDDYINSTDLTEEQSKRYKEVYLKQFKDMKYEIKDERIDGDNATVTAQITVYDYYSAEKESNDYLAKLESVNKTVDYTIEFNLTKTDNKWEIDELTNEQLEKIHGVYAY